MRNAITGIKGNSGCIRKALPMSKENSAIYALVMPQAGQGSPVTRLTRHRSKLEKTSTVTTTRATTSKETDFFIFRISINC